MSIGDVEFGRPLLSFAAETRGGTMKDKDLKRMSRAELLELLK